MITKMTIEEALEIKKQIINADHAYYVMDTPIMSDAEYDRLYLLYTKLEEEFPELKTIDSPTQRVGGEPLKSFEKFTHKTPLLSINEKSQSIEGLTKFYNDCGGNGVELIIQPKYDGLTINNSYVEGTFTVGATRGNGYIGENVTENIKVIRSVPMKIKEAETFEVRGEAVISMDVFEKNFSDEYSNPRNFVAGTIRQLDSKIVKQRKPDVIFYDIGECSKTFKTDKDSERLEWLKEQGFKITPYITVNNLNDLIETCTSGMDGFITNVGGFNILHKDKNWENGVDNIVCDGLVIKVNSLKLREELGMTSKGPKWAFAYKFKPVQAKTKLLNVNWQVGRTGRLTPVAEFEPVNIGGTTISFATLNNIDYIKTLQFKFSDYEIKNNTLYIEGKKFDAKAAKIFTLFSNSESNKVADINYARILLSNDEDINLDLRKNTTEIKNTLINIFEEVETLPIIYKILSEDTTAENTKLSIGNEIVIERSNDVIPRVAFITLNFKGDYCNKFKMIEVPEYCPTCGHKIVDKYPLHYCPNVNCPDRVKQSIIHFASRDAMNIVGLGDSIIDILVEKGLVKNIYDLYQLKFRKEELLSFEGFADKKVDNLLKSIENSKEQPLANFLYSLGIEGVGRRMSKSLVKSFKTLDKIMSVTEEELLELEDIGDIIAKNIVEFFKEPLNIQTINLMKNIGFSFENKMNLSSNKLDGKTFVVTGTLKEKRKYYEEIVEQNGGKISGSVSAKTFAVIIGEDAGSKEKKARDLVAKGNNIVLIEGHEAFEDFLKNNLNS